MFEHRGHRLEQRVGVDREQFGARKRLHHLEHRLAREGVDTETCALDRGAHPTRDHRNLQDVLVHCGHREHPEEAMLTDDRNRRRRGC